MEFTMFVSNKVYIDNATWSTWLKGIPGVYSNIVDKAIKHIQAHPKRSTASDSQVESFILSQYRQFELLVPCLETPRTFNTQILFPLNRESISFFINSYYGFEVSVMRELIGKRITQRLRKELDVISQKCRYPLVGCKRIFDNLKRMFKRVEEFDGPAIESITSYFLIPVDMAHQYANIIFMAYHRIETNKKRLAIFDFSDFENGFTS
jgi:hypothetical protein